MNHEKEGWGCTDEDNYQFMKKIDDTTFHYKEFDQFSFWDKFGRDVENLEEAELHSHLWHEATIDISTHSEKDIKDAIDGYGYTLEGLKESGGDWQMIVAECIFEQDVCNSY